MRRSFEDLEFIEEENRIKAVFLGNFYSYIDEKGIRIIDKNTIETGKAGRNFNFILEKAFKNLKSRLSGKKAIYIHKDSDVPLIGTNYFGLIDRGTNIIEIKPITGCNLDCVYCSVDEGRSSKKQTDYVVEEEYLVEELRKLAEFKGVKIEAHINAQGEPLLYKPIAKLVEDIRKIKQVGVISIDTNGLLLTKELIDRLAEAGLTRFNVSINALEQKLAEKIANCPYNLKKLVEMIRYISKKSDLIIAPVFIPGLNDGEMEGLIEFAMKLKRESKNRVMIGIQNFLNYRFGRNPVKQISFEEFYKKLNEWEKRYNIKLIYGREKDFNVKETKKLERPFSRNDIVKARILFDGRLKNEKIAAAKGRLISIPNFFVSCNKEGEVKVKIKRTKHNIYVGGW